MGRPAEMYPVLIGVTEYLLITYQEVEKQIMAHDFNRVIDRRRFGSFKWRHCDDNVLPMWIADMDFMAPEPVIRALRQRVDHGVFGYGMEPPELRQVIVDRLQNRYNWQVSPEELVFLPGVMTGVNLACHALASPGDGVLVQTPGYDSILAAPANAGLTCDEMELTLRPDGHYAIDVDAFEGAITDRTRIFVLCNPHNPVGRVFQAQELEQMAEICLRHNLVICSDEIHCDIVYSGYHHLPIATLDPEIADRTITLMAPSKTYNTAGLQCAVAIIQNSELREVFVAAKKGLVGGCNIMGYVAALAAYRDGQPWLDEALRYLEANRDFTIQRINEGLPGIRMVKPEGTYLAWLDCRQSGIAHEFHNVRFHKFFFQKSRVAVYNGAYFGRGGEGFVRLNFGCPRSILAKALNRMEEALVAL